MHLGNDIRAGLINPNKFDIYTLIPLDSASLHSRRRNSSSFRGSEASQEISEFLLVSIHGHFEGAKRVEKYQSFY